MKNIALFGFTLWLLAEAIDATRKHATLATSPMGLPAIDYTLEIGQDCTN